MAHTVYLGSFSKKLNSTAQPAYTGWTSYSCVFKDETSLYQPTLTLSASWASMASSNFNYAVMLGKYYWIRDIRAIRTNLVEVSLQIDPLATYKSNITSTNAFIEYGFNTFNAGSSSYRVADNRIAVTENPSMYTAQIDVSGGALDTLDGCYIVQAVGNNPNGAHKGLATFALTAQDLRDLMASVNTTLSNQIDGYLNNSSLSAQDVMNYITALSVKNEMLNESAMAAIQSVMWLPLDIDSAIGTSGTTSYLGNYSTNVQAKMLTQNSTYAHLSAIDIPWPVDDWRRNNCQLLLYIPFFGTIPVPIDQSINTSAIGISWTAEYFSGSISVIVRTGDGAYTIYAGSTNISVDMGIGRSMVGISGLMGGTIQALGGALEMAGGVIDAGAGAIGSFLGTGGSVAGAMSSLAGGAQNIMQGYKQTISPVITCAGTMGGMAAIAQTQPTRLTVIYYPPIDMTNFQNKFGHPVFELGTPASGFCKTRGFSVSGPMPGSIAAVINTAMDGGVYIE